MAIDRRDSPDRQRAKPNDASHIATTMLTIDMKMKYVCVEEQQRSTTVKQEG